jgi:hypothetical protein
MAYARAVLLSNFGGIGGALLSLDGGRLAARLKLDALYPVAGYKRCLDAQNGYGDTRLLPPTWWILFLALSRGFCLFNN